MDKEMLWHDGGEMPPLHEDTYEDEGGKHTSLVSDWMFVIDDTCDGTYNGPVRVARLAQVANGFQWEDGSGRCGTVFCWMPTTVLTDWVLR